MKFKVKDTTIMNGGNKFPPGSIIDLEENEAKRVAKYLEPVIELSKPTAEPKPTADVKSKK
jgi:hypothetical protein